MLFKSKKTLVIDPDAEQKAKTAAMQTELDELKPKSKKAELKDNSVETNRTGLKKIKTRTAKFVIGVVATCLVIGLIVWSVLYKNYLDKKAAEEAARKEAEAAAVEKANKAFDRTLTAEENIQCGTTDEDTSSSAEICRSELQLKEVSQVLSDSHAVLPEDEKNNLFMTKITLVREIYSIVPDQYLEELKKLKDEVIQYDANYYICQHLAEHFVYLDSKIALELFKRGLDKRQALIAADPEVILDPGLYPTTEEELIEYYGRQ